MNRNQIVYTKTSIFLWLCLATLPAAKGFDGGETRETQPGKVEGFELQFPALGTLVSFKAFHAEQHTVEVAFESARAEVLRLDQVLTDYDPESETRKLSTRALSGPTAVSSDLWSLLLASDRWNREAEGAFDASLGELTSLWRKYRRVRRVPSEQEIRAALGKSGWHNVQLDSDKKLVQFHQPGLRLDFGAIGKGYIVDRAFELLTEGGLACCLVNISGNMRCGIAPPDRDGWRVEVASLQQDGPALRRIEMCNTAIATSGDLWQYSVVLGQRRSHILDPSTGIGVLGPVSATVTAVKATDADAFATAACILPRERAFKLAQQLDLQLLLATAQDGGRVQVWETAEFPSAMDKSE